MLKIALTTFDNYEICQDFIRKIINLKLAVCVNVIKLENSVYIWQGQIENSKEFLLMIKTHSQKIDELKEHILNNHPYQVPFFTVIDTGSTCEKYFDYLTNSIINE